MLLMKYKLKWIKTRGKKKTENPKRNPPCERTEGLAHVSRDNVISPNN